MSKFTLRAKHYAEAVVSKQILTCEWVQKACQRQLDDLVRFKRKSSIFQFNQSCLIATVGLTDPLTTCVRSSNDCRTSKVHWLVR